MAVTTKLQTYPGLSEIVIDFGLGRAPRATTIDQISGALKNVPGVKVDNVGGLRAHEGVWGVNRTTSSKQPGFTPDEIARVKRVAERIAARG